MRFGLVFTEEAEEQLEELRKDPVKLKRVQKCLGLLETNPRHPGLKSHKYSQLKVDDHTAVFESYVENKTPAAWRVFWHYGPTDGQITILTITPHP